MKNYNCTHVCELGIYKGDNFMEMIKHEPKLAVAVDSWKDDGPHPRKTDDYSQQEFDEQYKFFRDRIADRKFVQVIRDYTVNAVKLFPDNFFDFVYIDADHSVDGCATDITSWFPKVKPGKFLVGHDYRRGYGVVRAVNDFVQLHNLGLIFLRPSTWAVVKND